jgi:hypothetical protein
MPIPEDQLETWSHQGSMVLSASTYQSVRRALDAASATYSNRTFEVFLQGSYGNDTNIYDESDVDVVIRYDGAFYNNKKELPVDQQNAFDAHFSDGTYSYDTFKGHALAALQKAFGQSVRQEKKAIKIDAQGTRRNADVVVAFEYRRYYKFSGAGDQSHDTGIAFFTSDGTRIVNYPKQHSKNLTTKHQATSNNFKPLIRIFKNMRSKLVADGLIAQGIAPSYFVEGLLYNAPNDKFSGTYGNIVLNILQWLHQTTDRTAFLCANEQYYLLRDNSPVCWPVANGEKFIGAAIELWNNW